MAVCINFCLWLFFNAFLVMLFLSYLLIRFVEYSVLVNYLKESLDSVLFPEDFSFACAVPSIVLIHFQILVCVYASTLPLSRRIV